MNKKTHTTILGMIFNDQRVSLHSKKQMFVKTLTGKHIALKGDHNDRIEGIKAKVQNDRPQALVDLRSFLQPRSPRTET
jgi:hypothetical protein